jgi:putative ABC transport system ATP-binding protein
MSDPPAIEIRNVVKTFEKGRLRALNEVNLRIEKGEFVALMGPSGCGKSTLLHLVAALDRPDSGKILIQGDELSSWGNLNRFRSEQIGLVFQLDNLLPSLGASENVQVPMFETISSARKRHERADKLLKAVGLTAREHRRPAELSGGERQRVAIARAMANDPPILLLDEPTGRLDSASSRKVLELLQQLRRDRGLTVIVVTHDPGVAAAADRVVRMLDGKVTADESVDFASGSLSRNLGSHELRRR